MANAHHAPGEDSESQPRRRRASDSSFSTTSLVLEHLDTSNGYPTRLDKDEPYRDSDPLKSDPLAFSPLDLEDPNTPTHHQPVDKKYKRWLIVLSIVCLAGWGLAFGLFIFSGSYKHRSSLEHNPHATSSAGSGKKMTMDQLQHGWWFPRQRRIRWIEGVHGEDGLLLEVGEEGKDFVVVENVTNSDTAPVSLMAGAEFTAAGEQLRAKRVWPNADMTKILVLTEYEGNWRHSFTGRYWIWDVETKKAEPLDAGAPKARIQLALWSPTTDSIAFVRDNNLFVRAVAAGSVQRVTDDGGEEMFNGVPDWVYEEEVFAGNSATWWSGDGRFLAFIRTNETAVQEYPVQYFLSRPSGKIPKLEWESLYPEVRQIKYPKAGSPNPVVTLRFYDVMEKQLFDIPIEGDFTDNDRLITEVVWAGNTQKLLVKETDRESNIMKMVVVDVGRRKGRITRTQDVFALDGGWFEVSETTTFVPSDPKYGRSHEGYIDTVIHEGYNHLAYFTPLESDTPTMLTTGEWEVVKAPSAVDFKNNIVYFQATKDGSTHRHVYSVKLDGTDLQPLTDTTDDGFYDVSFSTGAGYALLTYKGPHIPWQKVISTPSNGNAEAFERSMEENKELAQLASATELPLKLFSTINVDGFELNVVERRPPHFSEKKKYPVLFYLYGGPGSQQVTQEFRVDFQSYVASALGYIVVTVDGRGTGFLGRKTRCIIRGDIGNYESHDQIMVAKEWGKKRYVDETRMAIWGWSYGGYLTLKTLEQDAGQTFQYGMAVAPVTDWRFYDSIYTERWMHTPQNNKAGYDRSAVTNVTALSENTRFLFMHGVADDNVHMQSSLTLIDNLNLAKVENYDVHFFPDSDHSIFFHGANRIVYDKLAWWLTNAFNGEWAKIRNAVPLRAGIQG